MRKKLCFFLFASLFAVAYDGRAQGVLNKLKNKALQEVNALENAKSSKPAVNTHNKLSGNVSRTVAARLGSDETFDYGENCIDLGASIEQVSFISTRRNGSATQCFAYRNGVRTSIACPQSSQNGNCSGSVQCSYAELRTPGQDEMKSYVETKTASHAMPSPSLSEDQIKAMSAYMTPAQVAELRKSLAAAQTQTANQSYSTVESVAINFNGQHYGPYKQLQSFMLSPGNQHFYAVVTEDAGAGMPQMEIVSSMLKDVIKLAGYAAPLALAASDDQSELAYVALGSDQNYTISTSSGKSYAMPIANGFGGVWYAAGSTHVLAVSQNQLFRDGQVIKNLTAGESTSPCSLYVSADGKSLTVIRDNKISFSDGDYFEYPLKISVVKVNGSPYYRWLAFENQEVVIYQKPY